MADKIRCAHILVSKYTLAIELKDRLNKGESFERLATEYSIDSSRKRNGDLGVFGRGMMVKPFENAAFKLQKGEISDVIKTDFGYHIIKRLE